MNLSIIIPAYNVENYISKTLDSCLKQDFDDYEIIIVDDGSTDSTPEILDSYAEKYFERIRVFHKENGGVSSARNFGIEKASGKWIWFVDGDDWIAENCLKCLSDSANANDYDILRFGAELTDDYSSNLEFEEPERSVDVSDDGFFDGSSVVGSCDAAWNYWFLRKQINEHSLRFDLGMKYVEDVNFVIEYKSYCNCGLVVSSLVYIYYQRVNSAIHNINHLNYLLCMKRMIETCTYCLERVKDDKLKSIYFEMRITYLRMYLWSLMLYGEDYKNVINELQRLIDLKIYPYRVNKRLKEKGRSRKESVAKFMQRNVFPHKLLYLLVCRIRFLIKRVKCYL